MQCYRFFRRIPLALRRGNNYQQLLVGNLFEFVVARVDQVDAQFRRQQIVAQRFSDAARIAGLRGGDQGNRWGFGNGCSGGNGRRAGLLIEHAPEIAGNPGELGGSQIGGGRLEARQLLRV